MYCYICLVNNVLVEYDADKTAAMYTYGNYMISIDNSGIVSYYIIDGQASVMEVTWVNETITYTYSYDVFSNITSKTGDTYNPYLYNPK